MKAGKDWFRIGFFFMTSVFWGLYEKQEWSSMLVLAVFSTFLSAWMLVQKAKE